MPIPYSLALRHIVPGEPEMGNKTFPVAQYAQNLDMKAMAQHMASHGSKYHKGDIIAVATQLVDCIREQLLLGNRVNLGDLGTFYVTLKAEAADNAEAFSTALIKDVNVRWSPSTQFKSLINEATFTYVGTREAQAKARKAEKELLNKLATNQPGSEPTPDPDEGEDDGENGGSGSLE